MVDTTRALHCMVVTPERALLDETAEFVALPLYDGELGVLPGRAPLIGRLGYGELRILRGGQTQRFFVDGGFVQVRGDTVTVLTPRAQPAAEIDAEAVRQALADALAPATTPETQEAQLRAQERARAQLRVVRHHEGLEAYG